MLQARGDMQLSALRRRDRCSNTYDSEPGKLQMTPGNRYIAIYQNKMGCGAAASPKHLPLSHQHVKDNFMHLRTRPLCKR